METATQLKSLEQHSERLQWRMAWLYRQIAYLCNNDKGYCWAGNDHFVGEWRRLQQHRKDEGGQALGTIAHECARSARDFAIEASTATIRRWLAGLVEAGWVRVEVEGPNRRIYLAAHPTQILTAFPGLVKRLFERHFKRLLTAVLSGLSPATFIRKQKRSSNKTVTQKSVPKPQESTVTLSPGEMAVVVDLMENGIKPEQAAIALVKTHGVEKCKEQIEALSYRKAPILSSKGGLLRASIERGYGMPEALIKTREEAAQAAKRAEQAEVLRRQAEERKAAQEKQAAMERERREAEQRQRMQKADAELLPIWERAKQRIRETVKTSYFQMHVKPAIPVRAFGAHWTLQVANHSVPILSNPDRIITLEAALSEEIGQIISIEIVGEEQ